MYSAINSKLAKFLVFSLVFEFIITAVLSIEILGFSTYQMLQKLYLMCYVLIFIFLYFYFFKNYRGRVFSVILLCYLLYGAAVSFYNKVDLYIVLYQSLHELKFFIFTFIVIYFINKKIFFDDLTFIVLMFFKWALLLNFLIFIYYFIAPQSYVIYFVNDTVDFFGETYIRFSGLFFHPSRLACVIFVYYLIRSDRKISWIDFVILAPQLIFTFQRLEILIISIAFIILNLKNISFYFIRIGNYLLISLIFSLVYFAEYFFYNFDYSPRAHFFYDSVYWLNQSSYLGAGWGSMGSHSAIIKANSYMYSSISDTWWYEEGIYLTDTYWPHIFAEVGFVGFLLLAIYIIKISNVFKTLQGQCLFFGFFATSIFSSNFQSPFFLVLFTTSLILAEHKFKGIR